LDQIDIGLDGHCRFIARFVDGALYQPCTEVVAHFGKHNAFRIV